MKNFILFLFVFLSSFSLFGNEEIEGLLNKFNETYAESPAKAMEFCLKAEGLANELGIDEYDGQIALYKAQYYLVNANFDLCSISLNNAIQYYSTRNDKPALVQAYSLKENLLGKIGDKKASHNMLLMVVELHRELENWNGLTNSLNNLTLDYDDDLDSMRIILEELKSLQEHFSEGRYYFYNQNWGNYYFESRKYALAAEYFFKALKVAKDLKMSDSRATVLMLLGRNYRMYGQLSTAEKFAKESYDFSKNNGLIYEESEALVELITILEIKKDFQGAYEYAKLLSEIEKEIYDLQKIQKVEQIEGQLKLAEKEKIIAEGKTKLKAEKLELAEQKTRVLWMWAIIIGVILLLSFTVFIYSKTKKLNTTIQEQKEVVELKSYNLEEALSNLEDSLEYSKLIQNSMLPPLGMFEEGFADSFIMYLPKDIVSGDFYWMHKTQDELIFAVGDCTGHGVPGAMVSMVCHEALNKVIKEHNVVAPNKVLDEVKELVSSTFKKNQNLNDGMDISLCSLKNNSQNATKTLQYAGAHNPIWIIRKGDIESEKASSSERIKYISYDNSAYFLIEVKADKQPIGRFEKTKPFTSHEIELKKDDTLYLFSDGFADQFGGGKGKKFKTTNFKKLLISVQGKSMEEQKNAIHETFDKWMSWPDSNGEIQVFEQIDDVCVIGVRV